MTDEEAQRIKRALVVEMDKKQEALHILEAILAKKIAAGPPPPEQPDDWRPPWTKAAGPRGG